MPRAGLMMLIAATALCIGAARQTTRVGGHVYAFPPSVFEGGEVETGRVGTILIELAWPEMRPLTTDEAAMWPPRDTIRVLANSGAPVDGDALPDAKLAADIPIVASIAADPYGGIHDRASGHPPPPRPAPANQKPLGAIPGIGMQQVATKAPVSEDFQQDVFVREPVKQPEEVIACLRKDHVPAPACDQSFIAMNLIVKVSYPRALVPQWHAIHDRLVNYLKAQEVKS